MQNMLCSRQRKAPLVGALVLSLVCTLASATEVVFYTYHEKPPYFFHDTGTKNDPGIYESFVRYLNHKQSETKIRLDFQPRIRLEDNLNNGPLRGAIIGVNPVWFKDINKQRFYWSGAFMWDKDIVVTRGDAVFPYSNPQDLLGKNLALSRGLYFWGVSELAAAKKLTIFETNSDLQNMQMVNLKRVDATITSILTYEHFSKTEFTHGELKMLATPHDKYERMILFPKTKQKEFELLDPYISASLDDPLWQAELKKYHYQFEADLNSR